MGIVETNGVNFVVFQKTGSAKRWWRDYVLTRPYEKFIPFTLREKYRRQFERLQWGGITVTQYETRFMDLARHAVVLIPTERERMAKEAEDDISFQRAVDTARRIEMVIIPKLVLRVLSSFCSDSVAVGDLRPCL
nr:uncharacterized protein LOC117281532 [Nicotiana tomentosiformis]